MAKPNYSFEKRQREMAKKKKKEEKLAKRKARTDGTPADETDNAATPAPDGTPPVTS
jgi:hypothetical protein